MRSPTPHTALNPKAQSTTIPLPSVHPPNFDSPQHASGPSTLAHQTSQLPPSTFDFPNPQPNTETVHEPPRTHPMITQSQSGIIKPIDRLYLHTSSISPIPKNPSHTLKDPNWRNAMYDEYNALFKMALGYLYQGAYARLVANGSSQQLVDFDETFSPVVKSATIRMVLSLVVSRQWPIYQLDVKNAFLNGDLSETVYMHRPPGFIDNLYHHYGSQVAYLLIYVDDIILTASCPALLQHIIGLFLSQKKYAIQLLERAHMVTCNPSRTPVDTESKLGLEDAPVQDPTLYCSLAGGSKPHLAALKRILRYVQGTLDLGLHLYASSTTSLVGYTDADWAGCPSTRRSTSVIVSFWVITYYLGPLNDNTLYVVAETTWLRNLLRELHSPLSTVTLVYCDNVSAVYMYANPVQHQRTKHIEIDIHFVRDMVTVGQVRVLHVPSRF
ncbi:ribonuclease H-like domain-containing protein [Tanacetum coccineum]